MVVGNTLSKFTTVESSKNSLGQNSGQNGDFCHFVGSNVTTTRETFIRCVP